MDNAKVRQLAYQYQSKGTKRVVLIATNMGNFSKDMKTTQQEFTITIE